MQVKEGGRTVDNELASEKFQVERKVFFLDLRENQRGRFLRITEDVGGRRDAIVIPASGLRTLQEALGRVLEAAPGDGEE